MMNRVKFLQPVSMSLNYDDFIADNLKQDLINLGYKFQDFNANERVLFTNYGTNSNIISSGYDSHKTANDRYYINKYNPQLFLAIAAMTEGEEWIIGEYLVYIHENDVIFKVKELKYADWKLGRAANSVTNRTLYRKATLNELVGYFSMKKDEEILGYKLIKPEYEENAADLGQGDLKLGLSRFDYEESSYYKLGYLSLKGWSETIENLNKAGVLAIWFKPVYKEKYKADDFIRYGDNVYKVIKVENDRIYYREDEYSWLGIEEDIKIATEEEIEELLVTYFYINKDYWVRFQHNQVYHDTEDITNFVLELGKFWNNIPTKFAGYDARLDITSVKFTKTGCVYNTDLDKWLKIYAFFVENKKDI